MNAKSQIHCDLGEWDWGCWLPIPPCKLNSRLVTLSDGGFEDIPKYHSFHILSDGGHVSPLGASNFVGRVCQRSVDPRQQSSITVPLVDASPLSGETPRCAPPPFPLNSHLATNSVTTNSKTTNHQLKPTPKLRTCSECTLHSPGLLITIDKYWTNSYSGQDRWRQPPSPINSTHVLCLLSNENCLALHIFCFLINFITSLY